MHHAHIDKFGIDARRFQFVQQRLLVGFGKTERGNAVGADEIYRAGNAHVVRAECGGLGDGVVNGEFPERVRMHGELPAELVGGTGGGWRLRLGADREQRDGGQQEYFFHFVVIQTVGSQPDSNLRRHDFMAFFELLVDGFI